MTTTFFNLQTHPTFHSEEKLVNLERGRVCFVGLSILLVSAPTFHCGLKRGSVESGRWTRWLVWLEWPLLTHFSPPASCVLPLSPCPSTFKTWSFLEKHGFLVKLQDPCFTGKFLKINLLYEFLAGQTLGLEGTCGVLKTPKENQYWSGGTTIPIFWTISVLFFTNFDCKMSKKLP